MAKDNETEEEEGWYAGAQGAHVARDGASCPPISHGLCNVLFILHRLCLSPFSL